jgi:decaprenylphospho-beta-D-erythro-pentofuranosid-2-ulose 2-reductase
VRELTGRPEPAARAAAGDAAGMRDVTSPPRRRGRPGPPGRYRRVLLFGGTSEIGQQILAALRLPPGAEVLLAGRDEQRMAAAGRALPCRVRTLRYDAAAAGTHPAVLDQAFACGPVDLVISAAGILATQEVLDDDPARAGLLVETNFTGQVTTLLAAAARLRAQGHGTIVVLSSVAAVRPRRANYVYGSAKAGLDAFARGLADSLHGSGVRVLLVRPGFVIGRMTQGMPAAPLATTPAAVGRAVAAALAGRAAVVWVPPHLGLLATGLRLVPRPLWRRLRR